MGWDLNLKRFLTGRITCWESHFILFIAIIEIEVIVLHPKVWNANTLHYSSPSKWHGTCYFVQFKPKQNAAYYVQLQLLAASFCDISILILIIHQVTNMVLLTLMKNRQVRAIFSSQICGNTQLHYSYPTFHLLMTPPTRAVKVKICDLLPFINILTTKPFKIEYQDIANFIQIWLNLSC